MFRRRILLCGLLSGFVLLPQGIARAQASKFAYVADADSSSIWRFQIDTTGALTPLDPPTPVSAPADYLAVDPSGSLLFSVTRDNRLSLFAIGYDGSLAASGSSSTQGSGSKFVAVGPQSSGGLYAVVVNEASNNLSVFTVDPDNGLTLLSVVPSGGVTPKWVAFHPGGSTAYVTNESSGTISVFDFSEGALTLRDTVPAENDPVPLAVEPLGRFAYVGVSDFPGGDILAYTIDKNGNLIPNGAFGLGLDVAVSLAPDRGGRLYASANRILGNSGRVWEFLINGDGTLGVSATASPGRAATDVAVDDSSQFVYTTHKTAEEAGMTSAYRTPGLPFISSVGSGADPRSVKTATGPQ